MRTPEFVLATLDEAAPCLRRLRAALTDGLPGPSVADAPSPVLDFVIEAPGSLLHEVAEAVSMSVRDAEAELRALARGGRVQAAAGEDGVLRWWPVEAP